MSRRGYGRSAHWISNCSPGTSTPPHLIDDREGGRARLPDAVAWPQDPVTAADLHVGPGLEGRELPGRPRASGDRTTRHGAAQQSGLGSPADMPAPDEAGLERAGAHAV